MHTMASMALLLAASGGAASALAQEENQASAAETQTLGTISVVGDWLGDADEKNVQDHPGARDVIRRDQVEAQGLTNVRQVLNRIPGVNAPENNGTGGHDMALNFGIRGLNPRLATRSTLLMDGIPIPYAPYGQPQLSLGPISMGNMDAVDVVRGGGAVRYGPQNVGGIVNFVTRAIPEDFDIDASMQLGYSPSSSQHKPKKNASFRVGGTMDNGLGGAILYSGVRGADYRQHSDTRIDDVILKGQYALNAVHSVHAIAQYYDGEADMPALIQEATGLDLRRQIRAWAYGTEELPLARLLKPMGLTVVTERPEDVRVSLGARTGVRDGELTILTAERDGPAAAAGQQCAGGLVQSGVSLVRRSAGGVEGVLSGAEAARASGLLGPGGGYLPRAACAGAGFVGAEPGAAPGARAVAVAAGHARLGRCDGGDRLRCAGDGHRTHPAGL